jgi:hypothetical protein
MQRLQQRGDCLWTADDPSFRVLGVGPIGTRMTVVRLSDGRLILISPIQLPTDLQREIRGIGSVAFIVAPNRVHHLFAMPARRAFPDAKLLAAPGLPEKRPRIAFDALVTAPDQTKWQGELEPLPIPGIPFLNEVVFLHGRSRTLVLTDLCFNIRRAPWWVIPMFRLNDMWQRFGPSRTIRLLIRDPQAVRHALDHVLRWDFDRIVVTHGEVLESGGRQALRDAYAFLYR